MLNTEQQQVVDSTAEKILVLAGAGTGKTHCMLARIQKLVESGVSPSEILVLTFTNAAAYNMAERFKPTESGGLQKLSPEFKTFHAFCYGLITSDPDVRTMLGYSKVPSIILDTELQSIRKAVKTKYNVKLSDSKLNGTGVCLSRNEKFQYDLFRKCLRNELLQQNKITFDIICYEVCELFVGNHPSVQPYLNQYKYIFVDEFQDTDPKQWRFVQSFKDAKLYVIGDALQCQPVGTKVTMADMSEKNIEDLVPGDYVLSYNAGSGHYVRNLNFNSGNIERYTKRVTSISKHFSTNVVKITSETHCSRYTMDHITYARVHYEGNENSYVTYLMQGLYGRWRVGSTQLFLKGGKDFGVRQRLRSENGIAAWILGVYTNYDDAWLNEQIVSYKFGIPQTTWVCRNVRYTEEDLDRMYEILGDLSENAERCLKYYNRYIEYPMFTKIDNLKHFSKIHMFESRVCNLIPRVFDIVYPEEVETKPRGRKLHNNYELILSITNEPNQYVYGLDVEDNHNYVADGILTHNCLYAFRNADSSIIKSLASDKNWTTYRLHRNYRSTKQICDFANENSLYADTSYRVAIDSEKDGSDVHVLRVNDNSFSIYKTILERCKQLGQDQTLAVLCRTNAEASEIREYLKHNDISVDHNSCDLKLKKKLMEVSLDDHEFLEYLASNLTNELFAEYQRVKALYVRDNESFDISNFLEMFQNTNMSSAIKLMNSIHEIMWNTSYDYIMMYDKLLELFEIPYQRTDLKEIIDEHSLIKTVCEAIDKMSGAESNIYVGTIHSSKGLEYDEVHLPNVGGKSFRLTSEDNNNVYYVGITRAKTELFVYKV